MNQPPSMPSERYTPGYSDTATRFMAQRTIHSHAAFFQPYLKEGMNLLDCGCGPGTITLGLAKTVAPGSVTAVDRESSQICRAREHAVQQSIENIQFVEATIYDLPFPDGSFDAAFSHALFEHLNAPEQALHELFRVLKPGGILAVRSPDWGGFLIAPSTPELDEAIAYYKSIQQHNGGNPYIGRALKGMVRQAGLTDVQASASYECYASLDRVADYLALLIEASETLNPSLFQKRATPAAIEAMGKALRNWSHHPDALFAQTWCEVVGQKPLNS